MTISEKITAKMKELNISYREMETITSIPKSTIQRYAKGEAIPLNRVVSISKALGVTPQYLLGWEIDDKDKKVNYLNSLLSQLNDDELDLLIDIAETRVRKKQGKNRDF